jgi:hypothetical protein
MLETTLRYLIPERLNTFAKLTERGEPYYFDHWTADFVCLYYWFSSRDRTRRNRKRVPVSEIRAALEQLIRDGAFTRAAFESLCAISTRDGGCGFAVIGRILEALNVARYSRPVFRLTDADQARVLLQDHSVETRE